jgi:hypothetical protein
VGRLAKPLTFIRGSISWPRGVNATPLQGAVQLKQETRQPPFEGGVGARGVIKEAGRTIMHVMTTTQPA